MGKYFGTDGFRGMAGVELTAIHAYKIGRFLGAELQGRGKIAIGKDTRRSSYIFEYAAAAGIASTGCEVHLLHVTTTPCVSYIVLNEGFDFGIMISASHNPYTDNGIKVLNKDGEKISDELTEKIEAYLDLPCDNVKNATGADIGKIIDYYEGRERYKNYLISCAKQRLDGLKVGIDASNGSAWEIAGAVFDALGAKTYLIGAEPNGTNINEGCGSTHPERLSKLVRARGLDVGFAYDGDADRCIAVGRSGEVIDGDKILYILANELNERKELKKNTVVTTVTSNCGLKKSLLENGILTVETKVGDRFVYEEIKKGGYSLGGEESGHIIITKYASTGDGVLTSVKLAELAMKNGRELDALTSGLSLFPQISRSIKVNSKALVLADERLKAAKEKCEKTLRSGRILIRASGTEPKIRILVECENIDTCGEIASYLEKVVLECDV